jgi:protocatechuate 3,4-dioxygenase beta subunit
MKGVATLDDYIGRRGLLVLSGLGLTVLATAGWKSRSASAAGRALFSTTRLPSGSGALAPSCLLAPEQTQGPYYIPAEKVRSNIAERSAGTPLTLRLTVVDAGRCAPIKGAAVDVWHANAGGVYSGFESASAGGPGGNGGPTDKDTFLRGIQYTDAHGRVQFQTIYPGWYRGRTTHIHVMVHVGGNIVHTGQLYFADSLTDKVYQTGPYRARAAARDTRNSTDSIYASGGPQSTLAMTHGAGRYTGAITLGVKRA